MTSGLSDVGLDFQFMRFFVKKLLPYEGFKVLCFDMLRQCLLSSALSIPKSS
jgi:hypothetical protein